MVDSRQKGARAEADIVKLLSEHTGLSFKRIPMSGALDAAHGLKGDVYVPNSLNIYCIEVKHYKEDHLTSKVLTDKTPQIQVWWEQTIRESAQISRKPLLIYKFDRSKVFCAFKEMPMSDEYNWMLLHFNNHEFYTSKLSDWLTYEKPRFV
jgi:Holliday junction resolvase